MNKLFNFAICLLIISPCDQKQFVISSPEIDIVRKANEAYFKGDWVTFRSASDDNARIWLNAPRLKNTKITPDQLIDSFKADIKNILTIKWVKIRIMKTRDTE